jgi:hypothetical protein
MFLCVYGYEDDSNTGFILPQTYLYSPPEIVNRMTTQSSVFVFQFFNKKGEKNHCQKINNTQHIKIDKKSKIEIIRQLDRIEINTKSIFGDHDKIAKYITDKMNNIF